MEMQSITSGLSLTEDELIDAQEVLISPVAIRREDIRYNPCRGCDPEIVNWLRGKDDDMVAGDHIHTDNSISHHGVYLGKGMVAHYCSSGSKEGVTKKIASSTSAPHRDMAVRITCLHAFIPKAGIPIKKVKYSANYFNKSCVARIAIQTVGEEGFSLIWNNCEHFSRYCTTGNRESLQIQFIENTSKSGLAATAGAAGGGAIVSATCTTTAPTVAGSQYLGSVAQGIMSHTTLGGILSSGGLATGSSVVPAGVAIFSAGLVAGAVIGAASFFAGSQLISSRRSIFTTVYFLWDSESDVLPDPLTEGLPVYGPNTFDATSVDRPTVSDVIELKATESALLWCEESKRYQPVRSTDPLGDPRPLTFVLVPERKETMLAE
eukprot:TRINITY_DN92_c0_g2_i3.p1 TRINITY_DN92_c0_g2~~TRINITY_DN92_c0_g2_i3.p1  ORF type:complete len:378 (+),score=52.84 TRINITY_DN92_c0_g2_i3:52-1185(+)